MTAPRVLPRRSKFYVDPSSWLAKLNHFLQLAGGISVMFKGVMRDDAIEILELFGKRHRQDKTHTPTQSIRNRLLQSSFKIALYIKPSRKSSAHRGDRDGISTIPATEIQNRSILNKGPKACTE